MIYLSLLILILSVLAYFLHQLLSYIQLDLPDLDLIKFVGKPKKDLHAMAIFPHPDDETMMAGGLIGLTSSHKNIHWSVLCVTHGEHGDELMKGIDSKKLAKLRKTELHRACEILGVFQIIHAPFEDGTLKQSATKLSKFIERLYIEEKPDVVVTFEQAGLYGHPDHITLSSVIHKLQAKYPKVKVLYATLPKKVLRKLNLPVHMADDPQDLVQAEPEFKLNYASVSWKKYLAACCFVSQNLNNHGKRPLWLTTMLLPFEYFSTD